MLCFALAHNGILYNDKKLRKSEKIPQTYIETDSYIAVQLIEKKKTLSFDSIRYMAEKVEDSFCFTILSKNNELYIIKGDNPIALIKLDGFYMYASTKEILMSAVKKLGLKSANECLKITVDEGEILKISPNGNIKKDFFNFRSLYVSPYFSYYDFVPNRPSRSSYSFKKEYLDDLISYAGYAGIDEDTIKELLNEGYSFMEIEDMLYNDMINEYGYEYCLDDCEI